MKALQVSILIDPTVIFTSVFFAVAVLGLLGKMTGACAIESSRFTITGPHANISNGDGGVADEKIPERQKTVEGRLKVDVQLKALGTLGVWFQCSSEHDREVSVDDLLVLMKGLVIPTERVKISTEGLGGVTLEDDIERTNAKVGVIEIDVEGAWNDLDLDAGWNNEVGVEIYIT